MAGQARDLPMRTEGESSVIITARACPVLLHPTGAGPKWNGFLEHDPIESGRLYTLFTIWLFPEVFALTFRRPWGLWPAVVFVAGGGAIGLAGYLTGAEVWNPALAGWTYDGDLLVWGALAVSFPVAIFTRSPGCELGALPWLLAGRQGGAAPRPGCAVGLDRLDAWEASRKR
jgi:hypothetical protein